MIQASSLYPEILTRTTRVPWGIFLFLAVIFFVAHHDLFFVLEEDYMKPADSLAASVEEGNLWRRVAFLMLGLFGIASLMYRRPYRLKINGFIGWLILFFLVWTLLSFTWADDAALTFRRLTVFAMFCLGALAVSMRLSLQDILLYLFFSTTLYLLIGLSAEIALGVFHPFAPEYRFAGTTSPNHQGLNCALLIIAATSLMQSTKRRRGFLLALALVALIFLILTKSRTAFASSMLALLMCWSIILPRSLKLVSVFCLGAFLCLFLLLGDLVFPMLYQGVLLGREDESTGTLTGRTPMWEQCLTYASERPLQGYGYGGFWTPRHIYEISAEQGWGVVESHSIYLETLLTIGIVGFVSYVLILVLGIKLSFAYYRASLHPGYFFMGTLLTFCMLNGLLESAFVILTLQTFIVMVALARIGFTSINHTQSAFT